MSGEFQIGSKCWPAYLWPDTGREGFSRRPVSAHLQGEDTKGHFWEKTDLWQLVSKSPAKVRGTESSPGSGGSTAKDQGTHCVKDRNGAAWTLPLREWPIHGYSSGRVPHTPSSTVVRETRSPRKAGEGKSGRGHSFGRPIWTTKFGNESVSLPQ